MVPLKPRKHNLESPKSWQSPNDLAKILESSFIVMLSSLLQPMSWCNHVFEMGSSLIVDDHHLGKHGAEMAFSGERAHISSSIFKRVN